ncbi:MAG: tetratricopeptide repeat protein [Candidatus Binataceae bacterium]
MKSDASLPRINSCLVGILALFLAAAMRVPAASAFGWWSTGSTSEQARNESEYPEELVQEGVSSYERGDYKEAVSKLKTATEEWPDNSPAALYLGLAYLQQGDSQGAVSAWRAYTKIAPSTQSERSNNLDQVVAENLTVLIRDQEQTMAKQAAARERSLASKGNEQADAVAVTGLRNLGSPDLSPLGKGFAALLIADFSNVDGLTVVERQDLQAILSEFKLGDSSLADPATEAKAGHLLGAGKIVTGSYLDPAKDELRIDAEAADTANLHVLGNEQISGPLQNFFELEKQLAFAMLNDLGYSPKSLSPAEVRAVSKPETRSLPAFTDFSKGLEAEDQQDYAAAQADFQNALQLDPAFALAQTEHYFVHFRMSHHSAPRHQRMKMIATRVAKGAPSMGEMMAAMTVMRMKMRSGTSQRNAGNGHREHGMGKHGGKGMDHHNSGMMGMNSPSNGMGAMGGMGGMEPMGMGAGGVEGSPGMGGSTMGMHPGMGMGSGMMHGGMMK